MDWLPKVELRGMRQGFRRRDGSIFATLEGVDLAVAPGIFVSLVGSSVCGTGWWSRNTAKVVQPYAICFESILKLALAPLVILAFGIGLVSKVALEMASTVIAPALTTYSGVKAADRDRLLIRSVHPAGKCFVR